MTAGELAGLLGRDDELALIAKMLGDVAAGRGRAALIEGEPGIGKTALVETAINSVEAGRCEVLRGAFDELGQRFPLLTMMEVLGVEEGAADPRRADAAREIAGRTDAPQLGVRMAASDPVAAAIERLLSLIDRLCASGPVVLAVEDLHWADNASLLLWRRLCRATVQQPLLLLATCRPVPTRPELDRFRRELHINDGVLLPLDGLAQPEVTKLSEARLGGPPGPRLSEFLTTAAGNPLYIGELLDALVRSDAVRQQHGGFELMAGETSGALLSLSGAITDRLAFLSRKAHDVLRTAALLGPHFSVTDLAAVVGRPPTALVGILDEAMTAGVLETNGPDLRFRHGLLRLALYEALPTPLRIALHRHAAEALIAAGAPVERVAEVVLPVLDQADGWELDWIARHAGEVAARAPEIAAVLLRHALDRLRVADPRRPRVQDEFLNVAFVLGRYEETERSARAVLADGGNPDRIGRAVWFLAQALARTRRFEEADEVLAKSAATAGPLWRARHNALRSTTLLSLARHADARKLQDQALSEGRRCGDRAAIGQALYTQSALCAYSDDMVGALTAAEEAISALGDGEDLSYLRLLFEGLRTNALAEADRFAEAESAIGEALILAERMASTRFDVHGSLRISAGVLMYIIGRWDDGLAELDLAEEVTFTVQRAVTGRAVQALITGRRGQWDEAAGHLAALTDGGNRAGPVGSVAYLCARALEAEHSGNPEAVVGLLAPSLAPGAEEQFIGRNAYLPQLIRAARQCEDRRVLRAAERVCSSSAEKGGLPTLRADLEWCAGLLASDPAPVLAAAAYCRTSGRVPGLGHPLEDAAALQAAAGDLEAARGTLAQALEVYARLGAAWDARRATARLRPYGVRPGVRGPRGRAESGWGALTDTERRVAELVIQGLSNPDIAGRLLLSRRTVETHVSHILAKLEVRSRGEITQLIPA